MIELIIFRILAALWQFIISIIANLHETTTTTTRIKHDENDESK